MNDKLTLGQRIMADEEPFLKIVKIVCFLAVVAAGAMLRFHLGPDVLREILAIGGVSGYSVASVTVKDINLLITEGPTANNILKAASDIFDQAEKLKGAGNAPLPDLDTALTNVAEAIDNKPPDQAVVKNIADALSKLPDPPKP